MAIRKAYQSHSVDSIDIASTGENTQQIIRALSRDFRRFGYFDSVFRSNSPFLSPVHLESLFSAFVEGDYQPRPLLSVTDLSGRMYRTLNSIEDIIFAKYVSFVLRPVIERLRRQSGVGPSLVYMPRRLKLERTLRFNKYRPARYKQIHWLLNVQQSYADGGFNQVLFLDVKSCVADCDRGHLLNLLLESGAPNWVTHRWIDAMTFWSKDERKGIIPTPPRTTFLYPFTWLILRKVADRLVSDGLQFVLSLDDFCFYYRSKDDVSSIIDRVGSYLADEGLILNESKTRVVDSLSYTNLLRTEARKFRLSPLERAVARLIHMTRRADNLKSTPFAPVLGEISRYYLQTTTKRLVENCSTNIEPVPVWIDMALEEITCGGVEGTYLPVLDMIHWRFSQSTPAPSYLRSLMQKWRDSGSIYQRVLSHMHV